MNEVRNALKTSDYPLDAQSLTVRIVKELRPFVSEALKKELAKVNAEAQKKAASQVISEVTAELEPAVIKVNMNIYIRYRIRAYRTPLSISRPALKKHITF